MSDFTVNVAGVLSKFMLPALSENFKVPTCPAAMPAVMSPVVVRPVHTIVKTFVSVSPASVPAPPKSDASHPATSTSANSQPVGAASRR